MLDEATDGRSIVVLPIFTLTTFLSAALLFGVQPMVGRQVLPLLGGSPAVWTTCMLFFQALLLAGYAYAHFTSVWFGQRVQVLVHLLMVCLSLAVLPVPLQSGWIPTVEADPVFRLLLLLTVSIGGPFFALSATTPLLQRWFAATSHRSARDPYFLYAASNLGSMVALFAYPLLLEPYLGLSRQTQLWNWGYIALAVGLTACALAQVRSGIPGASGISNLGDASPRAHAEPNPSRRIRLEWVVLAFIPSSWMLGVTATLTTEFLPVPLLWVLPLALYLLTFILAFAERLRVPHEWMLKLLLPTVLMLALMTTFRGSLASMSVHLAGLIVAGLVCHGELVQRRPAATHLTEFYLCIAIGGALGGLLNAVVAPLVFSRVLEYPLTIISACFVIGALRRETMRSTGTAGKLATTLILAATGAVMLKGDQLWGEAIQSAMQFDILLIVLPVALVCAWLNRPFLVAVTAGVALVASALRLMPDAETLLVKRSFFGVHRVLRYPDNNFRLVHGTVVHGWQRRSAGAECVPRAYYHPAGPLGDVMATLAPERTDQRLALVGLGAGAAICYQASGQEATIYEIDPAVVAIAENPDYFTYLSHCAKGEYSIVIGDGRMQLARAEDDSYGTIILDTFTGDSVPTHLLTREAMRMYLRKLTADGILVVHISNIYLDLEPVVADLAADADCVCATGQDTHGTTASESGKLSSTWMVVARDPQTLQALIERPRWESSTHRGLGRPWTDDYSSVAALLNFRWR